MARPLSFVVLALVLLPGAAGPARAEEPPSVRGNPELTALIASLLPAVVNITILKQRAPESGPMPQGEAMMMAGPVTEYGSGFVIDPAGYVVTNRHVIAQAYRITVTFDNGRAYQAKVLSTNEAPDLALLKIDSADPLPTVRFGDSSRLRVGETVVAIGNPLGLSSSVSVGIVSALHRNVDESMFDDFIQTDAAINHGNSGGPLFNIRGEVIGVNWALIAAGSGVAGSDGLGLSIPSNLAAWVVDEMRKYGRIQPGWIGVDLQGVTQDIAEAVGRTTYDGGLVAGFAPGSEAAGVLREGDLILEFDGHHADDVRTLSRVIASTAPGTSATARVWRDGKVIEVTLKMAPWPAGPTNPAGQWVMPSLGRRVTEPNSWPEPVERHAGGARAVSPRVRSGGRCGARSRGQQSGRGCGLCRRRRDHPCAGLAGRIAGGHA